MWSPGPEILTVTQMSEVDRLATLSGVDNFTLMENAGRQVANEISKRWSIQKTTILCGPGNNGGDGYVVARHLQARGWPIEVVCIGDHSSAKADAAQMAKLWTGPKRSFDASEPIHGTLVVDAIFGAGLSRGLSPELIQLFEDIEMADIPVVAVDIPSGIHGDSAKFLDDAQPWSAKLTVTFYRQKPAHVLQPARQYCGEIALKDIGIADGMLQVLARELSAGEQSEWPCRENRGPRNYNELSPMAHKYQRGHCFVVSGPSTMTGAARLAGLAALRAGAGLVTILGKGEALPVLAAQLTSVMVRTISVSTPISAMLADKRITAVVVGPGNGVGPETHKNVTDILAAGIGAVLDADALTSFAAEPKSLFECLHANAVLTPHEGEFERLFPGVLKRSTNRIEAARAAAKQSGAVMVLKGADTVIATPDGHAVINTNAPADLATAGSGDVLAGIIGGLIAQGLSAFDAAKQGVFFHGKCGRLAGRGMIAEDLPDLLPHVMHRPEIK